MSKKLPATKRRWVEDNGSIYTADTEDLVIDFSKKTIQVRVAVAFNIGEKLARHIVHLHNESLK